MGLIDEGLIVEVLKEFGSPEKMARQYGKTNYLIGPRYYSLYTNLIRIIITVVVGASLVGFGVSLAKTDLATLSLGNTLLNLFGSLIDAAFQTFGIITLIFWGIERATPGHEIAWEEKWTPGQLLEKEPDTRVKIGEVVTSITFTIIGLVVFNFFQRYIGLVTFSTPENQWQFFPVLSDAFARYLPYLNGLWIGSIILNLYILNRGVLDKIARWGRVALDAVSMVILYAMVVGPGILNLDDNAAISSIYQGLLEAVPSLNIVIRVLLSLAMVGILVKIIIQVYKLIFKQTHLPIEEMIDSIDSIDKK